MPQQQTREAPERVAALRRRVAEVNRDADAETERTPHPLVTLGGQVGNAQVARMLAQREGEEEEEEVAAKHDFAQREGEEEEEEVAAKHDFAQREGEEEEEVAAKPEVGLEGGPLSAE